MGFCDVVWSVVVCSGKVWCVVGGYCGVARRGEVVYSVKDLLVCQSAGLL